MGYTTDFSRNVTLRNVAFAVKNSSNVDRFTVDASGNASIQGSTSMVGPVQMDSIMTVGGHAAFASTMQVSDTATMKGALNVSGATTLHSTLSVSGAVDMASALSVTGGFEVSGAAAFHSGADMKSQKITNLGAPTADADAANKSYVDAQIQGLDVKDSCLLGFSANQTLSNLTAGATVQSETLAAGDRILLRGQDTAADNGIYEIADSGAPTRVDDLRVGGPKGAAGVFTFIEAGTDEGNGFVCTNDAGSDVVGTDDLVFAQFSGAGQITAGAGMTKTGNTMDVIGGDGIAVSADEVAVDLATNSGMSFSSGKLELASSLAGAGLDLTAGVMSINTAKGIEVSGDNIQLAATTAGDGLAYSSGVLSVNAGDGLTSSNDAIKLSSSVAGNGLNYSAGVVNVTAGNVGIDIQADSIGLASNAAGNGLAFAAGVLSVNTAKGLEVSGDNVQLVHRGRRRYRVHRRRAQRQHRQGARGLG